MATTATVTTAKSAKIFAVINCCWLIVLVLLYYAYWNEYVLFPQLAGLNVVGQLQGHDPIGGVIPAYVPWAGALGGVTISLLGCVRYSRSWDPKLNIWHALRPALGAIAASIGFVILVLVLKAAAGTQFATDQIPTNPASQGLFFILGFILGFREGLFLELVQKIAKTILTTGTPSTKVEFEVDRNGIDFGPVPIDTSVSEVVNVTLTAPDTVAKLTVDSFRVTEGVHFSAAMLPASPYTPLTRAIEVTFKPIADGAASDVLEVAVAGVTSRVELRGSGVSLAPSRASAGTLTQPTAVGSNGSKKPKSPKTL